MAGGFQNGKSGDGVGSFRDRSIRINTAAENICRLIQFLGAVDQGAAHQSHTALVGMDIAGGGEEGGRHVEIDLHTVAVEVEIAVLFRAGSGGGIVAAPAGTAQSQPLARAGDTKMTVVRIAAHDAGMEAVKMGFVGDVLMDEERILLAGINKVADRGDQPHQVRRTAGTAEYFLPLGRVLPLVRNIAGGKIHFQRIDIEEGFAVQGPESMPLYNARSAASA